MPKLMELAGVRGGDEGFPVELWRDDETGRLMIVGFNQAGYDCVGIDLRDVIAWLHSEAGVAALDTKG